MDCLGMLDELGNGYLLRKLLEGCRDIVAIMDLDGRFLYCNAPERYGIVISDVVGKTYTDFWPPEAAARYRREFEEVVCRGEPVIAEDHVVWQGQDLWFLNHKYPIRDRDGEIIAVATVSHDITERKHAEEAMARSQRLLLALNQAAQAVQRARTPEAVYRAIGEHAEALGFDAMVFALSEDREHVVIAYLTIRSNLVRMAEKLVGLPIEGYRFPLEPESIYQHVITSGETVFDAVDAARIAEVLPRPVRPLAGRLKSLFGWQHRIIAPLTVGGEVQGLLAFGAPELTEADTPAVTAFANQAAIALANARLYQESRQLAAFNQRVIHGIAEGIVLQDLDGVFTFVNPAAAEILGYTPAELMGMHWTAITPPDQRAIVQAADKRRLRGEADRYELELVSKGDQRITVLVSGTPYFDAEGHLAGTLAVFADITARKQVEEALRFQALVLDQIQNSVVVSDPEGVVIYVNAESLRNQKRAQAELVGKPVEVYGEDPSRGATQQQIKTCTLENGEWHGEVVNYAADGTEVIVDLRTKLIKDDQGKPCRIVGIGADITERKRMEEALREGEEKYRMLFEEALNPILLVDEEAQYVDANKAALKFLECDRGELLDKHVWDFSPPALLEQQKQEHAPFVHRRTLETDYLVHGMIKTLLLNVVPVKLKGRTILYGIGQDITARKRAEAALRESEERIRRLIESTDDLILLQDLEGRYLYYNGPSRYGMESDDVLGKTPYDWFPPDVASQMLKERLQVIAKGEEINSEQRIVWHGEILWFSDNRFPVYDDDGRVVAVGTISHDITQRKRAEEALQMQAEELERINAELQQLAHAVSHDVAAPLRVIRYGARTLKQDYKDSLDETAKEMLGYVVEEATWMQRLIDDLREYARVHTRGRPFALTDCEEVLAQVLRHLALEVEDTGAVVTHDPLPTVMADEAQLVQLFQNLIGNGLKYHGEDPSQVHVAVEDDDANWVFAVRDNGIGIDPQHFERIFEIFQRLHTREEYDGTGVGLAVCQRIVQRHGGRIWVASDVGQGSTFYFTLPQE